LEQDEIIQCICHASPDKERSISVALPLGGVV